MRVVHIACLAGLLCLFSPSLASAQGAGVCDRQANQIGMGIARDTAFRIANVQSLNLPPDEIHALILLHLRARDRAFRAVEQMRFQCTQRYVPMQQMANVVVSIYTAGLSEFLPPQFTYVDVSEIMNGRPLGGPTAVVPKARDDVLDSVGIGGDAKKIIQDPKQILPWNW
ncbi:MULTISPECIES: hypothetical protein [unclassified Labrenzia]|uniref:hypothetical protein n=1 Tax=unclassified Labrenzia TaxID=2648686 RepID=UPI0012682409|nr:MULTISPECIES: hypothetical protein [unclassified Labrenzia]